MKHKKEHRTHLQPLLKWLTGDANRHDEQTLDASAKGDPFLADALEGYRSMPEADHAADVTQLKVQLRKKTERRRGAGFYLMRVAAVGAVLVAAWVILQQFQSGEKAAAVADAAPTTETSETAATVADSIDFSIASQEKNAASAADERVTVQEDFSSKTKKDAPQPNATTDSYFFNDLDKIAEAEAGAPPPVEVMDSKPAPTLPTNDAMAIQETQAAPAKDEDLSKAKAKTEARKQAEPAAKPGAPAPRKITGRATDENGEPLVGVSILASGKGIGTVTDLDGTYALGVPTGTESLIFTYTSYTPMQITLGKNDRLDVKLTEGDAMLSEVEVTAYDQTGGESAPIESPRPVGGFRKFKTYVSKNMRHPEADGQPRPRQIVKVRFTIQAVGTLSNFTAKGEAPQAYKDEAVRLLREGPRWSGTPITMASYRFVFE